MVNNKLLRFVILITLFSCSFILQAETKLSATVDRTKIYAMDSINLTIQGQVDMDVSLGGLMSFGLGQTESPEIPGLEDDFEILDRQQSYNMQSINGESKAQVLWRYTLAPKTTGLLTIPPATYKDGKTKPIEVTVLEGKAPQNSSEPPAVFLEVETDKTEVYVQEQVIYTLRLYTQGLINGELSEPSSTDAIIEPFGEQKKYYRMAFNQRYEVVERQYLLFPQKSGSLEIDAQTFQGVSLKHGRRSRLKDESDSIQLTIKPPASSFTGKNWLPATSLFLNEQWQGNPDELKVGDSLTRKVELSALGLLGSALPPISMKDSALYKLYTDKPQTESIQHESGVQAKRTDSFAVVAVSDGEIELDEIRIPWWDTVNDVERIAIIPARKLSIAKNPDISVSPPQKIEQETNNPNRDEELKKDKDAENLSTASNQGSIKTETDSHLWQTISGILLLFWIGTSIYLYRALQLSQQKLNALPVPKQIENKDEKSLFNAAISAIKSEQKSIARDSITWINALHEHTDSSHILTSLQDLKEIYPDIYRQLQLFDESLYAKNCSANFDKEALITLLKNLRQKRLQAMNKNGQNKQKDLEPFYR